MLISACAAVDEVPNNQTSLLFASMKRHLQVCKELIKANADINICNYLKLSPDVNFALEESIMCISCNGAALMYMQIMWAFLSSLFT